MPVSAGLYSALQGRYNTYPSKERFHEYVEEAISHRTQYCASCGLSLSVYGIEQRNPQQFVVLYLPQLLRMIMEHDESF